MYILIRYLKIFLYRCVTYTLSIYTYLADLSDQKLDTNI